MPLTLSGGPSTPLTLSGAATTPLRSILPRVVTLLCRHCLDLTRLWTYIYLKI